MSFGLSPLSSRLSHGLAIAASALLLACGGGSDPIAPAAPEAAKPGATAASVVLQTYITDNLATEYSKVWVTLKKITVLDAAGTEVVVFDGTAVPKTVNLSSLADVGQFMSAVKVPVGLFTQIKVTLGNEVQLVSLDGATTTKAKFSATGTEFVWTVREVSLDTKAAGQLVLDFNLAKFTYDSKTGLVTPSVEHLPPSTAFGKFVRQQAEVEGMVTAVNTGSRTLTMDDPHLGKGVIVTLATDAVIVNEATGAKVDLGTLVGSRIEAKGTVTPGATTSDPVKVTATVVRVLQPTASSTPPAVSTGVRVSGEGTVLTVNAAAKQITLSLKEANFLPGSNAVVVDYSAARFAHGLATDLAKDVRVEFSGVIAGVGAQALIKASVLEIAGAPSDSLRVEVPNLKFTAVQGEVVSVTGSLVTVNVTQSIGPVGIPAGTYTVDLSKAEYERGTATCLVKGARLTAIGTLSGATLTAKAVEIANCSGQERSKSGG